MRAHCIGRLDGDHVISARCKPGGVAPGAGAYIKNRCSRLWEEVKQASMDNFKRQ